MCRPLFLPAVTVQSNGIAFAAPGVYGMTETLEAPGGIVMIRQSGQTREPGLVVWIRHNDLNIWRVRDLKKK